jgi:hypothetical protein
VRGGDGRGSRGRRGGHPAAQLRHADGGRGARRGADHRAPAFRHRFPGQDEEPDEDEEQDSAADDDDEQIYGYAEEGDDYWRTGEADPDREPAVDEGWDDLAKEDPYDLDET